MKIWVCTVRARAPTFPKQLVFMANYRTTQVVYFQPLWLEVIDFLWEGVLGAAVWGGAAEPATPPAAASGENCGRFSMDSHRLFFDVVECDGVWRPRGPGVALRCRRGVSLFILIAR